MKLSIAALTGIAALASAQALDGMPKCAQDCATSSIPKDCGIDVKCICTAASFIDAITCCVAENCSADAQKDVIKFANDICGTAGVTNLPQSAVCTTGSQSATQSASQSGSASTSGTATTTATDEPTGSGSASATATQSGSNSADDEDSSATETAPGAEATESGNAAFGLSANGGLLAALGALAMAAV